MFGIKQEALALELGDDWNQKRISLLEAKETVDHNLLQEIAQVLKVPVEAIENFDEEQAVNIISNTFNEAAFINSSGTFNINPLEKWLETLEENKNSTNVYCKRKGKKLLCWKRCWRRNKIK